MTTTLVTGGHCLVGGRWADADLAIADGRIERLVPRGSIRGAGIEEVDATGMFVAPGFVDVQCNGAVGHDLTTDPRSIGAVLAALPRWGVTSCCPTVITSPVETRSRALDAVAAHRADPSTSSCADLVGLHIEGPALSPEHVGTHDPAFVTLPDVDEVDRWIASGSVAMVTLAPELDGVDEIVDRLVAAGVTVAVGHTGATAEQYGAARERGVAAVTHLFNAMRPIHHREPGVVGAALVDPEVVAGLVVDGHHVAPAVVDLAWRCLGDRLMLVTDASAALGADDGDLVIGSAEIAVCDGRVTNAAGALAGSALSMDAAVRNLVGFTGCSPAEAIAAATSTPAKLLGLDDRGALAPGRRGDVVVLTPELDVVATFVNGVLAWRS